MEFYTTSIIYKLNFVCYIDDMKENRRMKIQDSRKGKNMTAVRFAYYLNSERCSESLYDERKEWFSFACSYQEKQRQRITVDE